MRLPALSLLALVVALAGPARAENETTRFLGAEADRAFARLELRDPPMLDTGCDIAIAGSGSACVRLLDAMGTEKRFLFTIPRADAQALVNLAASEDVLGQTLKDRPGIPDEHRMTLELENALGERRAVRRWSGDRQAALEKVEQALRALQKNCERREPDYQGKTDPFFRPFAGIQVTVSLSMGRPDPTFEFVRPEDSEKVLALIHDLTPIERPLEKEPPGNYRGFLLAPRELPALPKWIAAWKGSVQVGDSPRNVLWKKDDRGLEKWLMEEAKKRGIEVKAPR